MKPSEMLVVAATAITLILLLRFAPNQHAESAVGGALVVIAIIYILYRARRVH